MIWGCISWEGIGPLEFVDGNMTGQRYKDILDINLWGLITKYFPSEDYLFQDDGASVHTAKLVKDWKDDHNLKTLPWPAKSPDLNIIENLWFILKHNLQKNLHSIKTVNDLKSAISRTWENVTLTYIRGLYRSMPNRIRQVQLL